MCPTQRLMEERSCAGNCVITPNVFKNTVLGVAAGVLFFGALNFWMHLLEFTLIAVGALTVGTVAGYVWWRRVIPARRAQAQALSASWQQQAGLRQPVAGQVQAQQPAQVHHHHGNVLSLPGVTGEELARIIRGER